MRHPTPMSLGFHLPFHSWGSNRNRISQLLTRHRASRYILRSSPLSLRFIYRSCFRHHSCICSLIPTIHRIYPTQHLDKNSLRSNIYWGQPNLLSTTLPRTSRYASTIFWLPWRLHPLKHSILNRLTYLTSSRNCILIHYLRSLCRQTRSHISRTYHNKRRVTTRMPTTISHIWRTSLCTSTNKITRKEGIEPP